MRRVVRWFSAAAVALVALTILQPALPASAEAVIDCGADCRLLALDAICWEDQECPIQIVFKTGTGAMPKEGITLRYRTRDGAAVAPEDYAGIGEGALVLRPGATSGEVVVYVRSDALIEPTEDFYLQITAVSDGLIESELARVTVLDRSTRRA